MSVVSGVYAADAASDAADTQAEGAVQAAQISSQTQLEMFNRGNELTAPWRRAGEEALNTLRGRIQAGPGEFEYEKTPGYEFRLEEGQRARERSAAARGNVLGGATQKALTRYGQDYATGDYERQRSNFLREYYEGLTPLQSLAGVGQSTASQTAANAQATGANIGNIQFQGYSNAANAQAAGQINAANAYLSAGQNMTNAILYGYNQWQNSPSGGGYTNWPSNQSGGAAPLTNPYTGEIQGGM